MQKVKTYLSHLQIQLRVNNRNIKYKVLNSIVVLGVIAIIYYTATNATSLSMIMSKNHVGSK